MVFLKNIKEYWLVIFIFVVGATATFWLADARKTALELKRTEDFRVAASDRINVIEDAVNSNIAISHSVVSFFLSSDNVYRLEFDQFTSQLLKDYKYIEAVEWAEEVHEENRSNFETSIRRELPDFAFKDIGANAEFIPSASRNIYFPIIYVGPISEKTKHILGVDFATNPVRKKAMEIAAATGQTVATAKIRLLISKQPGVLFFSPVIKEEKLKGFVISAVPLNILVSQAIEPLNKEGVNIIAYDISEAMREPDLLFVHSSRLKKASEAEILQIYNSNIMRKEAVINVAGRKWRVTIVPAKGFFEVNGQSELMILAAGFIFTVMLSYFMIARIHENIRIKSIVALRTKELEQLASYDPLTGLANRRLFLELLEQALARAEREKQKVGIVYIDLNDFKPVNDKLGHAAGDALLKAFGERINSVLRVYDTVARLGGDEFAILADNIKDIAGLKALLPRLLEAMQEEYEIMGKNLKVTSSIGVAIYPDNAVTLDDLMGAADDAMYDAKKDKSQPYIFFSGKFINN